MTTLVRIAASVGLVAATIIGLMVAGYGLQMLVRLLRHWDTSIPAPALRSGRIAGMEFQVTDVPRGTEHATRHLVGRVRRLEVTALRLSQRVLALEQRLLPGAPDDRT